jgi:hypothetical protein
MHLIFDWIWNALFKFAESYSAARKVGVAFVQEERQRLPGLPLQSSGFIYTLESSKLSLSSRLYISSSVLFIIRKGGLRFSADGSLACTLPHHTAASCSVQEVQGNS